MQRFTVIIPANNEAALIAGTLDAVLLSEWRRPDPLEVIVSANACTDETVGLARMREQAFAARGWPLKVLNRDEPGKIGALNAADAVATGDARIYLDADVTVSPPLLAQLADLLDVAEPRYASGKLSIMAKGPISRAYARIWRRVPFMRQGVPGAGLFAVNAAARARWGQFPDVIADDIFVRLQFAPPERIGAEAPYDWPIAEGFDALVRVRTRQDRGVIEIAQRFPDLEHNEDKPAFPLSEKIRLASSDPVGFLVYTGVALASRLMRHRSAGWSRGR
ncbi:glycosyltransferase family 2 protein [Cognatishimia sp. F0-27]|uniref:glycosyltransferase n=1 Tax=Cognatishimia sp. F0-27 TaxID=2816855 RepID=UPI001D0C2611|nr:glycosyltransferase family 2 protein [Cognatishimia sp. F0-27]MCC1491159.1 glycosyltransferase family 2 protein [Cognatishimia sp. F0-27]